MSIKWIQIGEEGPIEFQEIGAIVVVPVFNASLEMIQCFEAIVRNTKIDIPILLVDDCGEDRRFFEMLDRVSDSLNRNIWIIKQPVNVGFVRGCNSAFGLTGAKDVVLVNSDVQVGPKWLEGLRDAAYSSTLVATATALSNHASILSVPFKGIPTSTLHGGLKIDEAAQRVSRASVRSYPSIPVAIGHCVYIKRTILDLLTGFDEGFGLGYGEEVEFSLRASALGFVHVCADDVFVFHKGGVSFDTQSDARSLQEENDTKIKIAYPGYEEMVGKIAGYKASNLSAALDRATRALLGIRLVLDARVLSQKLTGTERVVIELLRALVGVNRISRIRVLVTGRVPEYVKEMLPEGREKVEFVTGGTGFEDDEILFRPYQVGTIKELDEIRQANWLLIHQLDFIAFHNRSYFSTAKEWIKYRDSTRFALSVADGVTFLSKEIKRFGQSDLLTDRSKSNKVIYAGVDHFSRVRSSCPVSEVKRLAGKEELILCIGTAYTHKNRMLALEIWKEMRIKGFKGDIVLAGATPPFGSSSAYESEFVLANPDLANGVHDLGEISESEKYWLYSKSVLVLHPTLSEGFGLVPFEAAEAGVPVLSTRQGSLDEVLPSGIPIIERFDGRSNATKALEIISNPEMGAMIVDLINKKGMEYTWERCANGVIECIDGMVDGSARMIEAISLESGFRSDHSSRLPNEGMLMRVLKLINRFTLGRLMRKAIAPKNSRREAFILQKLIRE
jgi:glycosyltransferase involved in cell wall biosynthesis/GT2 family glycosyltransferase